MSMSRHAPDVDALPPARRRLYAALVLLSPFLLLIAGEMLARLFYHPPSISLFKEQTLNGVVYRSIDPGVTSRYFPTLAIQPGTATDLFRAQKAPGTIRVFALGESSTLGYPYMMNGAFPAMLRDRLRERFPGRTIEVVNLGVTAVTSHTVLDFGRWCLDQEPDLLLVYAGHNEYYGALGVGSSQFVGSARWMVRTYLALHESRLFLALKAAVTGLASAAGGAAPENRTGTLMELMARKTAIPYGSATYARGIETYRQNIEALLDAAEKRGIPVVLMTLVSNMRDLAPLESIVPEDWPRSRRNEFESDLHSIDSLLAAGSWPSAHAIAERWAAFDTVHAGLAYRRAQYDAARGSWTTANEWYRRARDLDGIRFRAPSAVNEFLRSKALSPGVMVADAESVMVRRAPNGSIGREFLLEHVHPNLTGYGIIADAVEPVVLTVLRNRGFRAETEGPVDIPPKVTAVDSLVAAYRITILVNSWPFTTKGVTIDDLQASTWEGHLALSYLRKEFTWEMLHVRAAERYEGLAQLHKAADEYRALQAATPYNVSPFLRLGVVLQRQGDLAGALEAFQQSLTVEVTNTALLKLGEIAYETGQHALAIQYLTEALRSGHLEPGRVPEIRLAVAVATMRSGDGSRALMLAEGLVSEYPAFERGAAFLRFLRSEPASGARR